MFSFFPCRAKRKMAFQRKQTDRTTELEKNPFSLTDSNVCFVCTEIVARKNPKNVFVLSKVSLVKPKLMFHKVKTRS